MEHTLFPFPAPGDRCAARISLFGGRPLPGRRRVRSARETEGGQIRVGETPAEAAERVPQKTGATGSSPAPVCGMPGLVLLSDLVPEAIQEIRYCSAYNFIGDRIDGYEEPVALITREAALALKDAADEMRRMGYLPKVYDAYRPQRAVDCFVRWANDPEDIRMKEYFYPELEKPLLLKQGYIAERSSHSRGSTVDLTLFDMKAGRDADMGSPFDLFSVRSHADDPRGITEQQYRNRMLLRETMERHGFRGIQEEWWHFTLTDEPWPDTCFDVPVSSACAVRL